MNACLLIDRFVDNYRKVADRELEIDKAIGYPLESTESVVAALTAVITINELLEKEKSK